MIAIWNRRRLIVTYDMTIQAKVRDILCANHIDYILNPVMFPFGTSQAEYKFYVHKKDLDYAGYLIKDVFR